MNWLNWKVQVPLAVLAVSGLIWLLGEVPKPVLASEYQRTVTELNLKQLDNRNEFLEYRLTGLRKELLLIEQMKYEYLQRGEMPNFILEKEHATQTELKRLEDIYKQVQYQQMKLRE